RQSLRSRWTPGDRTTRVRHPPGAVRLSGRRPGLGRRWTHTKCGSATHLQRGQGFGGGAVAGADGAVDGAVRLGRGFGTGPVDAAARFADDATELREHTRSQVRHET